MKLSNFSIFRVWRTSRDLLFRLSACPLTLGSGGECMTSMTLWTSWGASSPTPTPPRWESSARSPPCCWPRTTSWCRGTLWRRWGSWWLTSLITRGCLSLCSLDQRPLVLLPRSLSHCTARGSQVISPPPRSLVLAPPFTPRLCCPPPPFHSPSPSRPPWVSQPPSQPRPQSSMENRNLLC